MLRSVNLNVKPSKMKIKLAKPNRSIVGNIVHFTKTPTLKLSLGRLNEISFTIPYQVDKGHELVENKIADLIRNRYLLKVKWNNVSEWFVINDIEDSVDDGSEGIVVHAFSLGHELADKLILELKETSLNPEQILTKGLSSTSWSIGTIDPKIINKYRSFDVSETSVLNFLYTIADTFGVLVTFDTENQKVNLVHPDNYKVNRGFKVAYGQYLKSLTRNSNSDDMTTRLIVTGKDGLSINKVNPTGANYIESFSYFMYPFERDANRNVLQSSDFMSDGLCHAILDYDAKVESYKGEFADLLTQLDTKQQLKATKEDELFVLETDLQIIIDEIEIRKAANVSYSDLITQRNTKQTQVNNKKAEITTVQTEIDTIYARIDAIKTDLAIENNFTSEQIIERNRYIIIKKWSDENYIDDKELYEDAKVKFDDVRKPKLNMQTGSVNFFQMIEEQRNWDKLYLGDVVTVRHPRIKASYEVFVTDIEISDDNLNLTIADYQEIRKDEALLEKLNKSYSSSISLDMSKYKWNETSDNLGEINDLINNAWDAAKRRIIAGVRESVEISNRGIIIKNPDFPNEMLVAQSGVLALSKDAGETWKTAITPSHIVAEVIMGRLIAGENLIIENSEGKFTFDQNGATIQGNSFNVIGGANGVEIDSDTGLTITKSDNKVRAKLNATDGIKIQSSTNGTSWVDRFYADVNGVIHAKGLKILSSDGSSVLIDGDAKKIDLTKFVTIAGKLNTANLTVRDLTNFVWNSDCTQEGGYLHSIVTAPSGSPTPRAVIQNIRDGYAGEEFEVQPNEQFYVGGYAYTNNSANDFGFGVRFTRSDGSYTWYIGAWAKATTKNSWQYVEGTVTAPSDAEKGLVFYQIPVFDNFGTWYHTKSFVRRVSMMTFDKAKGGQLTLGGVDNGNGQLKLLNANNEVIADLDATNFGFEELRIGDVISDSVVKTNYRDLTYYVDPTNGDDSNSGLSSSAKKATIQSCLDDIPKFNAGSITILCSSGLYRENVLAMGYIGDGLITIDLQNNQLNGNIRIVSNMNRVDVKNATINSANDSYATIYVGKTVQSALTNLKLYCRNSTSYGISAVDNSFVQTIDCEIYDTDNCIRAGHGSQIYVRNCKGIGGYGVVADYVGTIGGTDAAPVGTISNTREIYGGDVRNTFTHDSGERALPTPPPPPTAPDTTKTWSSSSADNYSMNGWGWINEGVPKQGNYGYGRRKGLWFFGSGVYDTVNGKNIKRVRVYIKRRASGGSSSDVTIQIRSHNYSSKPAGEPTLSSAYKNVSLSWGEGAWVDLPSDFITAFKSGGARGIGVYVASDSSSYYAIMESAAKIEITYS